ncbi:hypothetical protein BK659_09350 [Pseudomonas brassicacearum]|uniref:Uncharacterized protein n=1 Tax=Pseudomonas brassicacearum TaxID=930166 RepID=A0A423HA67_9PSED|nr:hypothetical protein [Pseudomonas brassicacearum]RON10097.1 hypothetical protein BK659_09350 [Pseudomonas brassicacearum]
MALFSATSESELVPLDIPDALPNIPDPNGEINLLPAHLKGKDLNVVISQPWANSAKSGGTDRFELLLGPKNAPVHTVVASFCLSGPIDPDLFPLVVTIPKQRLVYQGPFEVFYRVSKDDCLVGQSPVTELTTNWTPPNYGNTPVMSELPEEVVNGVTTQYLETHDDCVAVTIKHTDYLNPKVGDEIHFCMGGADASPIVLKQVEYTNSKTTLLVPGEELRRFANGIHLIFYTLKDRAGNEGPNSKGNFIRLALDPPPAIPGF